MPIRVATLEESVEDAINALSPAFHLPITELSGTTIKDVSGNGRDGTLSGTVTLNNATAPDGKPAALFGGGHIEIPSVTAFAVDATLGITVGCLIKFDTIPTTARYIVTKGNTSKYEWELMGNVTAGNGNIMFAIYSPSGSGLSYRLTNRNPLDTSWAVLIGRGQSRAQGNLTQVWKNSSLAIQDATQASPSATAYVYDSSVPVRIGARADNAVNPVNGYIRNAFMLPEAIDQASIQRIVLACQNEGWGF